ncbi:hypothetical protein FFJ24_005915 [Pedobacter sp. KBS0701]|uniref:hypothetical protein n=1 Tax=Pedobacter sp. KBS0701 TaxID=2578106 RepID=UPI00110E963C|nr:hypothetical protein [Pedobacter sp. KBS0701]QDW24380.1 hypothetical protein FFJ24_005915 [Pedobacter sp. KBS0701]
MSWITYRMLIFSLLIVVQLNVVSAQTVTDSLFVASTTEMAHKIFFRNQEATMPIFNGKIYNIHPKFKENKHAFFQSEHYVKGGIAYDGIFYPELSMKYDIIKDELLLLAPDHIEGVVLQREYVNSFTLYEHQFINLKPATSLKGISAGYYDLLYKGKICLLVKRQKEITEKIEERIEKVISSKDSYYLLKDSSYQQISSKKDLLKLLNSTNDKNQAYIKANKLNFGKDFERSVLMLVGFHDSISK